MPERPLYPQTRTFVSRISDLTEGNYLAPMPERAGRGRIVADRCETPAALKSFSNTLVPRWLLTLQDWAERKEAIEITCQLSLRPARFRFI